MLSAALVSDPPLPAAELVAGRGFAGRPEATAAHGVTTRLGGFFLDRPKMLGLEVLTQPRAPSAHLTPLEGFGRGGGGWYGFRSMGDEHGSQSEPCRASFAWLG